VELFNLIEHPGAVQAFAWTWHDGGKIRYTIVLRLPPINSAEDAVQAALSSGSHARPTDEL
jgi:hypothetical protein